MQAKTELSSPFQLSGSDARLPMTLRLRAYVRSKKYMRLLGLDSQFPYLHLRCCDSFASLSAPIPAAG